MEENQGDYGRDRDKSPASLRSVTHAVNFLGYLGNPKRKYRHVKPPEHRQEVEKKKKKLQEEIRSAFYVYKAALRLTGAVKEYRISDEAREAGFNIHPDDLASMVRKHDGERLKDHNGVEGIASKLCVSLSEGVCSSDKSSSHIRQREVAHLNGMPSMETRKKIYGLNQFAEKPPRSFLMFVWEALHDLTLVILMVCAVVSIGVGLATEGWPKGMYDGLGILLSIILVVMVTAISDYRQYLQFSDLDKEKKKIFVHVTRDGKRQKVSIYDLVVGDVVHLSVGDQVPADGIFVSGYSLKINESSLTGETDLLNVNEKRPFLFSGTKVQDGSCVMLVTAVGMRTEWGKLMETLSEDGEDETPLQIKLNAVATVIGKIGLVFAVLTFIVLTSRFLVEKVIQHNFTNWSSSDALKLLDYFATAVTIIVVAVPEGLPLAVTLSLAFAMKKLMNERALVRRLAACETMGSASCICTDKTGTLTTNHMTVVKTWLCGITKGIKHDENKDVLKSEVSEEVQDLLLQGIFQNTAAEVVKDNEGRTSILGTPTETALLEFGLFLGGDFDYQRREFKILKVRPFNSEKKKMSVLVALPQGGTRAFCKGASEIVLGLCNKVVNKDGQIVELSEDQAKSVMNVINDFASEALRTLCVAFKDIDDSSIEQPSSENDGIPDCGYTLIGVVGIKDPVRPGVKDAVKTCLSAGINVRMVTGDNIITAKAIAKECGILTEGGMAVEGSIFRTRTREELLDLIPNIQVIARSLPGDKQVLVEHLRSVGEVVAVTGDGTNDAPALHKADIGLAMGIAGTEVAKDSADVIILDDNFATIVNVAKWGRSVYINIQKFVQFQLTVNVVALVINFLSACISGSAPLTAVQLLWVNMIMDTLGALALATEPPTDELLKRPPVRMSTGFITKTMWRNIFGQSIYQLAVLFVLNFAGKQLLGLSGPDSTAILNTLIFNTFVFCQVFNEINSRDMQKINVFRGMFDIWIFLAVIVVTVAFQAIIVQFLGTFASTVPLNWQQWLLCVVIGSISMIVAVILKCIPVGDESKDSSKEHHDGYEPLPSGPDQA